MNEIKSKKYPLFKFKGYRAIDYLSDLALEVWGRNIAELFESAASGMFSMICSIDNIEGNFKKEISINSKDIFSEEEFLVMWLNKLLYFHETEKLIFSNFVVKKISFSDKKETGLITASCTGDIINLRKHEIFINIKAVTFHDLKIYRDSQDSLLKTKIIFDV